MKSLVSLFTGPTSYVQVSTSLTRVFELALSILQMKPEERMPVNQTLQNALPRITRVAIQQWITYCQSSPSLMTAVIGGEHSSDRSMLLRLTDILFLSMHT